MIHHLSRDESFRRPFGAAEVSAVITLSAECGAEDMTLRLYTFAGLWREIAMEREGGGRFTVSFTAPEKPCVLWYSFAAGGEESRRFQITVYKHTEVPAWWKGAVVYQIFPDRFYRGDDWVPTEPPYRRGTHRFLIRDWDTPVFYPRNDAQEVTSWPFWGGTLRGIEDKLDYLRSLGVTALYLNPIFEARSNHRYDTGDYMHVDALLGSDEDFSRLCREAEKKGIRIVLDGVFNHTGVDSIYFDACGNYGTGEQYRQWFRFGEQYTHGYECWWDVPDLPNVEENEPSYRAFLCGEDGVVRHWLREGAAGWRLDVADELPDSLIREIRTAMKAEREDAVLMGEVWEDASNKVSYGELREYFLGEELDCTMHYPFREIALDFLQRRADAHACAERLWEIKEHYPRENLYAALNLIGSHDRERVLTLLSGDKALTKLAMVLQFVLPGVPCIYYGDEAGMTGGRDPYNRGTFPWGREDADMLSFVRSLTALYEKEELLRSGEYEPLFFGADVLGCRRYDGERSLTALVNRSERDIACFGLTVPAKGFAIG